MVLLQSQSRKVLVGRQCFGVIILLLKTFGICGAFLGSTTSRKASMRGKVFPPKSTGLVRQKLETNDDDMGESKPGTKTLGELLLPSQNCSVDQMSGTDLGTCQKVLARNSHHHIF